MARQPSRTLYLYLALACFLGIVVIFFFDGYMGVYDSLKADNGVYVQEVSAGQWQQPGRYGPEFTLGLDESGSLDFTYRVENRRFTGLSEPVRVTVSDATGASTELVSRNIEAGAFDHGEINWTLNGADFVPAGATAATYNLHLAIERGSVTRELSLFINRNAVMQKTVPVPAG